ncbi:unnamed protein product [Phaedon cochleariae]|uniref:Kazal-like domain-containing protein n=1 Tax=Phaedon cochleariae TaxID=80249 RepID=A0A9N9SGM3_PHACE|nr:unnamed protein product [Phaedon cochleariae]
MVFSSTVYTVTRGPLRPYSTPEKTGWMRDKSRFDQLQRGSGKDHRAFGEKELQIISSYDETCNPKSCSHTGDNEKPVCSSDGLTYPNRCIFEKTRCLYRNLTITKRGPCKKQRPCQEWDTFNINNRVYNNR